MATHNGVPSPAPGSTDTARHCRVWARLCALIAVLTIGYTVALGTTMATPSTQMRIADAGTIAISLAATIALIVRYRRARGRLRTTIALVGLGAASWLIGKAAGVYLGASPSVHHPGWLSLVEIGHLAQVPLTVVGLLVMPVAQLATLQRLRSVVDGLMIATSLLLISWFAGLETLLHTSITGTAAFIIDLTYPMSGVVTVTIIGYLVAMTRRVGDDPRPLLLFGAAITAVVVGDIGYAYVDLTGGYIPGGGIDVCWFIGFALLVLASTRPAVQQRTATGAALEIDARPVGVLLPYAAVLGALATGIVFHPREGGDADPFLQWTRSALIVLIVGRQLLTLLENGRLTRHLESRVAGRTDELLTREQRFKALVQQSSDSLSVLDADGIVIYQSDSVERIFGHTADELTGGNLPELLGRRAGTELRIAIARVAGVPYATTVAELGIPHRDGRWRQAEVTVTNLLDDPHVGGFVLNTRDISDSKDLQHRLVHDAYHDALTGLGSKALFRERLQDALAHGRGRDTAVLFLDLDGFKKVNDSLGHAAGDQLLVQVAARLCRSVRENDMVARFGGDEFAVLIQSIVAVADAETVARRIVAALREPLMVQGREMHVGASIGLAAAADAADMEQLLRNADLAMYKAKAAGGNGVAGYDPRMLSGLVERLELESDLRLALERGELQVHYQPTVDLVANRIVGFESLVRWCHPERGMISPLDFIGVAEATGLIIPLGRWVLAEACRQAVCWAERGHAVKMAVNVSVRQFDRSDLAAMVTEVLQETGMPAALLCLEMTESVLMTDSEENLSHLLRLKELGVTLAMDDFGTGYSSLAYLGRYPMDTLKIDRSFVQRLDGDSEDVALVQTIVGLGRHLGMSVIAEGIEEPGELAVLRAMGCPLGQGYLFSRPVPADEAGRLLQDGLPVIELPVVDPPLVDPPGVDPAVIDPATSASEHTITV